MTRNFLIFENESSFKYRQKLVIKVYTDKYALPMLKF